MALNDRRKFNFYQKYIWSPTDFANLQTWLMAGFEGLSEGLVGAAVLSGLRPQGGGGMTLLVNSGVAANASGRLVVVASQLSTTVTSPAGNPARTLVVLRPKETAATSIPQPDNPGVNVFLHEKLEYDLIVLNGTPAASPAYPSTQAGDIIVAGLRLNASHTTITEADLDWGVVDRPRKRKRRVALKTASFTLDSADEIIEVDFSAASGVCQLPAASGCEGLEFSIVKIDSGSNNLAVSGQGAELISGQNVQTLDTQWQSLNIYSNGQAWRMK